jgi:hypothetical protein
MLLSDSNGNSVKIGLNEGLHFIATENSDSKSYNYFLVAFKGYNISESDGLIEMNYLNNNDYILNN